MIWDHNNNTNLILLYYSYIVHVQLLYYVCRDINTLLRYIVSCISHLFVLMKFICHKCLSIVGSGFEELDGSLDHVQFGHENA